MTCSKLCHKFNIKITERKEKENPRFNPVDPNESKSTFPGLSSDSLTHKAFYYYTAQLQLSKVTSLNGGEILFKYLRVLFTVSEEGSVCSTQGGLDEFYLQGRWTLL